MLGSIWAWKPEEIGELLGFPRLFTPYPYTWLMTTLIAFQGPNFAILGADSQITDGDKRILSPSIPKIVKLGKYLLGVAGDVRPGDILTYNWKPPLYDGTDPVKFMGKKVIPSIITAFRANGYDHTKEGASYSFLIVFAGNVFEIGDDLSMSQSSDGLYGIGSGSAYALGVMQYALAFEKGIAGATPKSVTDAIECALTIAAQYDINTSQPFQIEVQRV